MLASLVATRDMVCAGLDKARVVADCVDHALGVQSPLERTFWIDSLANVIRARLPAEHANMFAAAVRRIEATFAVTPRERHDKELLEFRRWADSVDKLTREQSAEAVRFLQTYLAWSTCTVSPD